MDFVNLKLGDTGNDVIILQEKLKMLGLYNPVITGSFGKSTEIAVKVFQKGANLEQTGIVDEITWDKLKQYTEPIVAPISNYPTLSIGDSGSYVIDLQTKLKALLYYTEDVNGNFNLETLNAVKRFQLNNDLTADGKVGSQTWQRLDSLYGNLNSCVLDNDNNDNNNNANDTYIVKSGDTLYSIASRFNTTVDAIKVLNNLTNNIIKVGQVLKIPTLSDDNYITYTVKSGDTLYKIANKYNTTVSIIKDLNNLTSDILQIGQVLKIPTSSEEDYINYIVKSGDRIFMENNE